MEIYNVFFIPNKFKCNWIGFVGKRELKVLNVPPLKKTFYCISCFDNIEYCQTISVLLRSYR